MLCSTWMHQARVGCWCCWEMHRMLSRRLIWRNQLQKRYAAFQISLFILFNLLQIKLDDVLEEIIVKLTDKYPPGLCPLHSDLPCFHHHVSDLHFNLDRPRLLVWAQAIKLGTATYEKVPIVSPMFKSSHALKHASKTSVTSVDSPITSTLPTPPPT